MRLLDEHGDAVEADLLRFYRVDLLDFYRGTLTARRLGILVRHLPRMSATSIALNDGEPPWNRLEHLIADLWKLWAKTDHPGRAAMELKIWTEAKQARVVQLKSKYRKRKRDYGLE